MKHLNPYKIFEADIEKSELEKLFGITEDEVRDIMQDTLDSMPEIDELKISIKPLWSSANIYNLSGKILDGAVDYFIVWINSKDGVFNAIKFKEMIPDIDSKFGIYGLEVFYAAPLSNRMTGTNIWIKRIKDKSRDVNKVPKVEIKSESREAEEYNFFNKLKKVSNFLPMKRIKTNVDLDTLKDILDSELDGMRYLGIDIGSSLLFEDAYYKSRRDGSPRLKEDTWFGEKFAYATSPDGNFQAFIDRGIDNALTRINSGNYDKGIEMRIDSTVTTITDIRESFKLSYEVYKKISKDRLSEYGIGCCLFKSKEYRKEEYSILFYLL